MTITYFVTKLTLVYPQPRELHYFFILYVKNQFDTRNLYKIKSKRG